MLKLNINILLFSYSYTVTDEMVVVFCIYNILIILSFKVFIIKLQRMKMNVNGHIELDRYCTWTRVR